MEGLALDPRQGEDRQIDHRDNDDPEDRGANHFTAGLGNQPEPLVAVKQTPQAVLGLAQAAQAVLDDDHRTIDDQPEIERTKAHQIG